MNEDMNIGTNTITVYLDSDGHLTVRSDIKNSDIEGDHFSTITKNTTLHPQDEDAS